DRGTRAGARGHPAGASVQLHEGDPQAARAVDLMDMCGIARASAPARSCAVRFESVRSALRCGTLLLAATGALGAHRALAEPASLDSLKHALELGHYAEAERAGRERLTAEEQAHGPESAEVGQTLDRLAFAEISLGRSADARRLAERAVRIK